MIRTLLLPGLDGSPDPHWQSWWLRRDPNAIMVEQESWSHPTPEAWETQVAGALLTHPGAVLVGHSLGAVIIARILTRWPQLRIGGALLVAPADPTTSRRLSAFAPLPQGRFPVPAIVVASRSDPWMSFAQAEALSRTWGAELHDMGDAGHINTAAGFGPWPEGQMLRDRLLSQAAPARGAQSGTEPRAARGRT